MWRRQQAWGAVAVALVAVGAPSTVRGQAALAPDRPSAIYKVGETITWTATAGDGGVSDASYQVKRDGLRESSTPRRSPAPVKKEGVAE